MTLDWKERLQQRNITLQHELRISNLSLEEGVKPIHFYVSQVRVFL